MPLPALTSTLIFLEAETQPAKEGTKIGLLPKSKVLADFKKIARGTKSR